MGLIGVIVTLIVVGLLLWGVDQIVPMDPSIRRIIRVVVIIAVVLWLISIFFGLGNLGSMRMRG
jgi:preprotein translocase subunit SecE